MTKGSFLPVRPRYRREVDGQRLSAKADDKVCCFSPVRRSTTYQMSCFLPEKDHKDTQWFTLVLWKKISLPNKQPKIFSVQRQAESLKMLKTFLRSEGDKVNGHVAIIKLLGPLGLIT